MGHLPDRTRNASRTRQRGRFCSSICRGGPFVPPRGGFSALALLLVHNLDARAAGPAEKRVALVIGNSAYKHTPVLPNPTHDSADMASSLTRMGFKVIQGSDLDLRGMQGKLEEFARAARDSDVALVFYAGHGLQYLGDNYIVPVDAELRDDISLDYQTLQIEELLRALDRTAGIRILILDACRDLALGGRKGQTNVKTGFAKFDARRNMLVAYSTVAAEAAFDGNSRNSFFTGAILKEMEEPGLEVGQLFRRVAAEVSQQTGGKQVPEVSRTLVEEFYFNRGETDAEVWARLRTSADPQDFRDFVKRFPKSFFVEDAKGRILTIENEREAAETIARIEQMRRDARPEGDTALAPPPAQVISTTPAQKEVAREPEAPPAPAPDKPLPLTKDAPDVAQIEREEAELRRSFTPQATPEDAERAAIQADEEKLRSEFMKGRQVGKLASADDPAVALNTARSIDPQSALLSWSSIKPPETERERVLLRAAQEELVRLGCLTEPPDGTMDGPTDIALRRFGEASSRFVKSDRINEDLVRALMNYGGRLCATPCSRGRGTCS